MSRPDLHGTNSVLAPVDLVYAALVFEYVDVGAALCNLRALCRPGGLLVSVLQLPAAEGAAVSPSPFVTLGALAPVMRLVAPSELEQQAARTGFVLLSLRVVATPSGKRFAVQRFRRVAPEPPTV